mgnify:CR=1 FL=1
MRKMLIVDDDLRLRALVKTYAEMDNFHCQEAENGKQALEIASKSTFDIIVLDVMMPEMDGFDTLGKLREFTETPVILLTARKEEQDKLFGFNLGADDYIPKPFSPKELMARIKAVLKRTQHFDNLCTKYGALEILEAAHAIQLNGVEIPIPPKEYYLLLYLAKNNHITLSREQILKSVWDYDYFGGLRTVDTHIQSLRERLGDARDLIKTVRGVGYKFEFKE